MLLYGTGWRPFCLKLVQVWQQDIRAETELRLRGWGLKQAQTKKSCCIDFICFVHLGKASNGPKFTRAAIEDAKQMKMSVEGCVDTPSSCLFYLYFHMTDRCLARPPGQLLVAVTAGAATGLVLQRSFANKHKPCAHFPAQNLLGLLPNDIPSLRTMDMWAPQIDC